MKKIKECECNERTRFFKRRSKRMKNFKLPIIFIMIMLLTFFSLTVLSFGQEKEAIKIGAILSLTGEAAEQDITSMRAVLVGEELLNAGGGIHGYPISLIVVNGESKPATFATKAHRLVESDLVLAGLGGNDISVATAAGQVFQDAKTSFIDVMGTTPTIPLVGEYMFMSPAPDNDMGRAVAKYAYEKLGYDTITIFKDVASAYGTKLTEYAIHFLKEFSGKDDPVPFVPAYNTGDVDYSAQLTRLKPNIDKLGIQAIFLPAWPNDIPTISKQARELGINIPLIGGDAADTKALYDVGGDAVEGMVFCTHFDIHQPGISDSVMEAAKLYKANYGEDMDASAAMGYDAFMIIAKALDDLIGEKGEAWWDKASLAEKRVAVKDAIASVNTGTWTTAPVSFTPEGWPTRGFVWKQAIGGERVYLDFQTYADYTPEGTNVLPFK